MSIRIPARRCLSRLLRYYRDCSYITYVKSRKAPRSGGRAVHLMTHFHLIRPPKVSSHGTVTNLSVRVGEIPALHLYWTGLEHPFVSLSVLTNYEYTLLKIATKNFSCFIYPRMDLSAIVDPRFVEARPPERSDSARSNMKWQTAIQWGRNLIVRLSLPRCSWIHSECHAPTMAFCSSMEET